MIGLGDDAMRESCIGERSNRAGLTVQPRGNGMRHRVGATFPITPVGRLFTSPKFTFTSAPLAHGPSTLSVILILMRQLRTYQGVTSAVWFSRGTPREADVAQRLLWHVESGMMPLKEFLGEVTDGYNVRHLAVKGTL